MARAATPLALALALVLGLTVRLYHMWGSDFPLNDGGLFFVMARDIQRAGFRLPPTTSYNSASIPLAYPPLPLYVLALLDAVTPLTLVDGLRFLPLVANVFTIGAFFLLCRAIIPGLTVSLIATPIFAILPRSYKWPIMGAGLTRSFGFLFGLLALHEIHRLYTQRDSRFALSASVCAALTVLSHPEVSVFVMASALLMLLFFGRHRQAIWHSLLVAGGVLLLSAPWWGTVLIQHGTAPLLAAAQNGGQSWGFLRGFVSWDFTDLPYLNWPAALAILGAAVSIARGYAFAAVWLVVICAIEPRSAATYAMAPVAMLSAVCIAELILPLWNVPDAPASSVPIGASGSLEGDATFFRTRRSRVIARLAVVSVFLYLGGLALASTLAPQPELASVSEQERQVMAWIAATAPADAKFLVVGDLATAGEDPILEWFPALTGRVSLTTPHGYEWFGNQVFSNRYFMDTMAKRCAWQGAQCLEDWSRTSRTHFTHVYVGRQCCGGLESSLMQAPNYILLYRSAAASVFARRTELPPG